MCGITAIFYKNNNNALEIYESLLSIQHRGQDGAGICCINDKSNIIISRKGLVSDSFDYNELKELKGNVYLGHNRYKTNNVHYSFQPFNLKNNNFDLYLCHNGNIINTRVIENILKNHYDFINENEVSDSLLLLQLIFYYINKKCSSIKELNENIIFQLSDFLHDNIIGSYSLILYIRNFGLILLKDKNGIRPLVFGKNNNNDILVSSESCSFNNILNYKVNREIECGETLILKINGEIIQNIYKNSSLSPCLFEYIYFSRLDSMLYDISVYNFRFNLGKLLGKIILENNLDIDFIIPTPETSRVYAYGLSNYTKIPIQECIIKNRYINRTFIIKDKKNIELNVKRKFSVIKELLNDKKVLLIDDSIVRGNTSKNIINLLKEGGTSKIFFASAAPKIYNTNQYGIYIEKQNELITYKNHDNKNIAKSIGADMIFYNNLYETLNLIKLMNNNIKNMEISMFKQL